VKDKMCEAEKDNTEKTAFQKNNETVERGKQYLSKNCKVVFEVSKTLIERLRAIDVMLAGDDEWDRYCHEVMGDVTDFRNLNIEQVQNLLKRGLLLLDKHGKHLNISLPFLSTGGSKAVRLSVARTIIEQLGGNRFKAMTGAHTFVDSGNGVSFQIGKNPKGVTHVKITLDKTDTYRVEFYIGSTISTIITRCYANMLSSVFKHSTGLDTHLSRQSDTVRASGFYIGKTAEAMAFQSSEGRFSRIKADRGSAGADFEERNGSLYVDGSKVLKGWESAFGWYWFAVEKLAGNIKGKAIWFGFVQGEFNEWGTFSEAELDSISDIWELSKEALLRSGRR